MKIGETIDYAEGIEVLHMRMRVHHDWNDKEYVSIGGIEGDARGENGTISLELVHFPSDGSCKVLQACLVIEEIDMILHGLAEAKRRLMALNK